MSKYDDMKANGCSDEYIKASQDFDSAIVEFNAIQYKYRLRMIGDAEFLAGRAEYDKAEVQFDAAYAIAQSK